MAVTQALSVTQSTAPSANATAKADEPAWRQALSGAQATVQMGDTPNSEQGSTKETASGDHKTAEADGKDAPQTAPAPQKRKAAKPAEPLKASLAGTAAKQAANGKDEKKDNAANGGVVATAVATAADLQSESGHTSSAASTSIGQADSGKAKGGDDVQPPLRQTAGNDSTIDLPQRAPDAGQGEVSGAVKDKDSATAQPVPQPGQGKTPTPQIVQIQNASSAPPATPNQPDITATDSRSSATTHRRDSEMAVSSTGDANSTKLVSTAEALTARAGLMPQAASPVSNQKQQAHATPLPLDHLSGTSTNFVPASESAGVTQISAATGATSVNATASALAATVTALHQSGQASTVLKLDPPGLGHLSVQVGLGTQGQVNVLFVPSNADAAQALQSALPNLGNAMAQSGLTLGQAQVGGQFSQQQGQGGQGGYTPARQGNANGSATDSQPTITGLSAYA